MTELLLIAVVGGVLALDGTSVGQFMVSRPLVAGALTGWLLGDPGTGVLVGAVLELYLLVAFPTGGARFPEGGTATVVAVASGVGVAGPGALPLAVAAGLLWGQVGGLSTTAQRDLVGWIVPEPGSASVRVGRVVAGHLGSVALDFVRGALVTGVGAAVGRWAVAFLAPTWPLGAGESWGLVLLGGAVSGGILLRALGGFGRRGVVFLAGLLLGLAGARLL